MALVLAAIGLQFACSRLEVADYADMTPVLDPVTFFDGRLSAHGVVKNRAGKVIRSFNADIEASWQEGVGTLVEDFVFDDGEIQQRIWTLSPDGSGAFIGTANDVIGQGRLQAAGNSLFLDYVLRVPYRDGTVDLRVDDRMYLVSPEVLVNESRMSKFGWQVGSILLVIQRHSEQLVATAPGPASGRRDKHDH
jgi:hypothetical protein